LERERKSRETQEVSASCSSGLAVSAGLGSYLGSARLAGSTSTAPRTITLRSQDVAVFGRVRCSANVEARTPHFLCSKRPRAKAKYEVSIFRESIVVWKMGFPDDPVYTTP